MNDQEERIEYSFDCGRLMAAVRNHVCEDFDGAPSLRDLANFYGISASTFSRLDANWQPDLITLCKICSILDTEPSQFFIRKVWMVKS